MSFFLSHRQIGQQLDLFHFPLYSPGIAFWQPRGLHIYHALERYFHELGRSVGYQEVRSPQVCSYELWQKSGHADKFSDKMFNLNVKRTWACPPSRAIW
jgi:threonyl-tRNA synthetase